MHKRNRDEFVRAVFKLADEDREYKKACDVACALNMFTEFPKVSFGSVLLTNLLRFSFHNILLKIKQETFIIPLLIEDKTVVAEAYLEKCKPMQVSNVYSLLQPYTRSIDCNE